MRASFHGPGARAPGRMGDGAFCTDRQRLAAIPRGTTTGYPHARDPHLAVHAAPCAWSRPSRPSAAWSPSSRGARAIVRGTDQVGRASPRRSRTSRSTAGGIGQLHGDADLADGRDDGRALLYEKGKDGDLLGIAEPAKVSVRVGSTQRLDPTLGVAGRRHRGAAAAVLPLGRRAPHPRRRAARARPRDAADAGDARRAAPRRRQAAPDRRLRQDVDDRRCAPVAHGGADRRSRPGLVPARSERSIRRGSSAARPRPIRRCRAAPPATATPADRRSRPRTPSTTSSSRASSATARAPTCEFSRSYLVLVSSERGFIDRALATPPEEWSELRDDPPPRRSGQVRRASARRAPVAAHRRRPEPPLARRHRLLHARRQAHLAERTAASPTNRWARFRLSRAAGRFTGWVCAQGADATKSSRTSRAPASRQVKAGARPSG